MRIPVIVGALGLVGLIGCGGGGSGSSSGSSSAATQAPGQLSLSVTDAPYPFSGITQAIVTIDRITIHLTGSSDEERPEHAPAVHKGGFIEIDSRTRSYDLVALQQGKKALVTTKPVTPGIYNEIRLHVVSGTITLDDGRTFPLEVPGDRNVVKIKLRPPVVVQSYLSQELVLDFDLSRSFEPVPGHAKKCADIREFKFHPVIRASVAEDSGAVAGYVTDASGAKVVGATVTVSGDGGTHTVTTSALGGYFVGFLPAGTYTVKVETTEGLTGTTTATIAPGNEALASVVVK